MKAQGPRWYCATCTVAAVPLDALAAASPASAGAGAAFCTSAWTRSCGAVPGPGQLISRHSCGPFWYLSDWPSSSSSVEAMRGCGSGCM